MVFFNKDSTNALGEAFRIYDNKAARFASNLTINGKLDVVVGETMSKVTAHVNHAGNTGFIEIEAMWRNQAFLNFTTDYAGGGYLFVTINNGYYMYCGDNIVYLYKPLTQSPGDRLKENEVIIENACETLSKLRPQLYDKEPDIDNDDPTTWHKESGLIAQELYYDAPELRHLIHKDKPDIDEEGNGTPVHENTDINRSTTRSRLFKLGYRPSISKLYRVNRIFSQSGYRIT